jgi:Protein of unknown function (DUF2939)
MMPLSDMSTDACYSGSCARPFLSNNDKNMFEYVQKPGRIAQMFRSRFLRIASVFVTLFTILVGVVALFLATPYYSLWNMRTAAVNRDSASFCSYIDFPVLRDNLKAELNAKMLAEMAKDDTLKNNPFAGFGAAVGPAIINNMVDGYVTPAAIDRIMKTDSTIGKDKNITTQTFNKDFLSRDVGDVESAYRTFNEFQVLYKPKDGSPVIFVFERRLGISWQLINIKFE